MHGDHTRFSTVLCCPTCGARVVATTREQAWAELRAHQTAGGCTVSRR